MKAKCLNQYDTDGLVTSVTRDLKKEHLQQQILLEDCSAETLGGVVGRMTDDGLVCGLFLLIYWYYVLLLREVIHFSQETIGVILSTVDLPSSEPQRKNPG